MREELLEAFSKCQTLSDTPPLHTRCVSMNSWIGSSSEMSCVSLPYISMISSRFDKGDPSDAVVMEALFPALDRIFNTNLSKSSKSKPVGRTNIAKTTISASVLDEIDENSD